MAPVIEVTREGLIERRTEILAKLEMSWAEYLAKARANELSDEDWSVRDDLDTIAFLLGESEFVD